MRAVALSFLLLPMLPAYAGSVQGFCERDGKRITFTDGIAFVDARDSDGVVTTTLYLTAKPLDRKALAQCAECAGAPGENTFSSPRGDLVEAQRTATADGWMEIQHVAGELDMATIVNIMYLAKDGVLTGIDGGNGKVVLETNTPTRIVGMVVSEAHEAPMNETDMTCKVAFDLVPGWPKP
ncbi:MAG: hypothetical protein WAS23_07550 [Dokdonella sp.]|jgi:hypothetical protein|uniref:hypothetical protein n=1 Tax=Dokdonella sp. TaxID=2291710 RepID=UPI003BAE680A